MNTICVCVPFHLPLWCGLGLMLLAVGCDRTATQDVSLTLINKSSVAVASGEMSIDGVAVALPPLKAGQEFTKILTRPQRFKDSSVHITLIADEGLAFDGYVGYIDQFTKGVVIAVSDPTVQGDLELPVAVVESER